MKERKAAGTGTEHGAAEVVVSSDQIAERVGRLAEQITECYGETELTILAALKGAVVFLADLIRRLPIPVRIEVAQVGSYPDEATTSQGVRFALPLTAPLAGRHVLILDDILDSGKTMKALLELVESSGPASVRSCVLLRKPRPDVPDRVEPDFVGFDVPNEFIVGYGLDFNNLYRNLPDLCVLRGAPDAAAAGEETS